MKLLVDDADVSRIKEIEEFYPIDGVTTNPSILAKNKKAPYDVLTEIREFIGDEAELHVQVVGRTADVMVDEAHRIIRELGENTFVKIPSVPEGFRAMKELRREKIKLTATAVYTPVQALLAAKCGAHYVAPYINRIDNLGYNGIQTAKRIHNILEMNKFKTEVLAASFKNTQQILELCEYGIGAATISPEIIKVLVENRTISFAIDDFINDFEKLTGEGQTMSSC